MALTSYAADDNVNPLVPHLSEIILVLIIFGILLYLIAKTVVPRFESTFAARRDAIEGGIARAEAAQAEAQRTLEEYRAQLADVRTEAAQIRQDAHAQGQRIIAELRSQAQEESDRILARADEQLATQRSQIVRELRGEIGTLAVDLAEKIVEQNLSQDANVQATVDSFLAGLAAQSDATSGAV